jgi:hypothetical protein
VLLVQPSRCRRIDLELAVLHTGALIATFRAMRPRVAARSSMSGAPLPARKTAHKTRAEINEFWVMGFEPRTLAVG